MLTTSWYFWKNSHLMAYLLILFYFLKDFMYFSKGREGERQREKHQCVVASHTPLLGTWPATQAQALAGNWTSNPLVHRPALNPLSHTSQGYVLIWEREEGKESERQRGRKTSTWERNLNWLPPVHTLTRDQTHNLGMCSDRESSSQPFLVYRTMFQPAEPPGQR